MNKGGKKKRGTLAGSKVISAHNKAMSSQRAAELLQSFDTKSGLASLLNDGDAQCEPGSKSVFGHQLTIDCDAKDYFPQALPRKMPANVNQISPLEMLEFCADTFHRCYRYELKIVPNSSPVNWNIYKKCSTDSVAIILSALKSGKEDVVTAAVIMLFMRDARFDVCYNCIPTLQFAASIIRRSAPALHESIWTLITVCLEAIAKFANNNESHEILRIKIAQATTNFIAKNFNEFLTSQFVTKTQRNRFLHAYIELVPQMSSKLKADGDFAATIIGAQQSILSQANDIISIYPSFLAALSSAGLIDLNRTLSRAMSIWQQQILKLDTNCVLEALTLVHTIFKNNVELVDREIIISMALNIYVKYGTRLSSAKMKESAELIFDGIESFNSAIIRSIESMEPNRCAPLACICCRIAQLGKMEPSCDVADQFTPYLLKNNAIDADFANVVLCVNKPTNEQCVEIFIKFTATDRMNLIFGFERGHSVSDAEQFLYTRVCFNMLSTLLDKLDTTENVFAFINKEVSKNEGNLIFNKEQQSRLIVDYVTNKDNSLLLIPYYSTDRCETYYSELIMQLMKTNEIVNELTTCINTTDEKSDQLFKLLISADLPQQHEIVTYFKSDFYSALFQLMIALKNVNSDSMIKLLNDFNIETLLLFVENSNLIINEAWFNDLLKACDKDRMYKLVAQIIWKLSDSVILKDTELDQYHMLYNLTNKIIEAALPCDEQLLNERLADPRMAVKKRLFNAVAYLLMARGIVVGCYQDDETVPDVDLSDIDQYLDHLINYSVFCHYAMAQFAVVQKECVAILADIRQVVESLIYYLPDSTWTKKWRCLQETCNTFNSPLASMTSIVDVNDLCADLPDVVHNIDAQRQVFDIFNLPAQQLADAYFIDEEISIPFCNSIFTNIKDLSIQLTTQTGSPEKITLMLFHLNFAAKIYDAIKLLSDEIFTGDMWITFAQDTMLPAVMNILYHYTHQQYDVAVNEKWLLATLVDHLQLACVACVQEYIQYNDGAMLELWSRALEEAKDGNVTPLKSPELDEFGYSAALQDIYLIARNLLSSTNAIELCTGFYLYKSIVHVVDKADCTYADACDDMSQREMRLLDCAKYHYQRLFELSISTDVDRNDLLKRRLAYVTDAFLLRLQVSSSVRALSTQLAMWPEMNVVMDRFILNYPYTDEASFHLNYDDAWLPAIERATSESLYSHMRRTGFRLMTHGQHVAQYWYSTLSGALCKRCDQFLAESGICERLVQRERGELDKVRSDDPNMRVSWMASKGYQIKIGYKRKNDDILSIEVCIPSRGYPCNKPNICKPGNKSMVKLFALLRSSGSLAEVARHLREFANRLDSDPRADEVCLICLEAKFAARPASERRVTCIQCNVVFHRKCLYRWFATNSTVNCPHCQTSFDSVV